jgi:peptidoglycan-N-acetylglucosamine deacetylase
VASIRAAGVATGRIWPDALSGGASIATQHGPLLLVDGPNVPAGVTAWAKVHGVQLTHLLVFGGQNAVPGSAAKGVASDVWGTAWTSELQ